MSLFQNQIITSYSSYKTIYVPLLLEALSLDGCKINPEEPTELPDHNLTKIKYKQLHIYVHTYM